jgi:hypothetical protein
MSAIFDGSAPGFGIGLTEDRREDVGGGFSFGRMLAGTEPA